jgi:arsenate reductase (thioredoxin)
VSRPLKRVLFVCVGNSCRSQMAEAFARAYGSDVVVPASAGLAPAGRIAADTIEAMEEKGIDVRDQFPKAVQHLVRIPFDLVINMSGEALPDAITGDVRSWDVEDPINLHYQDHCEIRDQIERLVMNLILELRQEQAQPQTKPFGSGRVPLT